MHVTNEKLADDLKIIDEMPFLPSLLELVCAATGLGFAAVARVTEDRWIAGAVRDTIQFGLGVGGELPVQTTICHEIRQNRMPVIIDQVSCDSRYRDHHTPAMYGFESYISFPIIRRNGEFFGTLCAIDPKAAMLNTLPMIELFSTLSGIVARYVDGDQELDAQGRERLLAFVKSEFEQLPPETGATGTNAAAARAQKAEELAQKISRLLGLLDTKLEPVQ